MTAGRRRVAVTGLGVVLAAGTGADALWQALLGAPPEGHRAVADWDPSLWLGVAEARHTDRFTQFAVAAAASAVEDAGNPRTAPDASGVVLGTALAGVGTLERQALVRSDRGDKRVSPFTVPMIMPNAAAAAVSQRLGRRGPCRTVTTACAAGTDAIGSAARLIADGVCDSVLTGGTEAALSDTVVAAFHNMRALSPGGRTRPFDAGRDGFAIAEGAAVLLLEAYEAAAERGARVYAEVLGHASTADAYDITLPLPDGSAAARCMLLALRDAGLGPADVGQVSAHGTGTRHGDLAEARALTSVFGSGGPPVTSAKGITGHAFGASGAIEAVAAILSMAHGLIPPVAGLATEDAELGGALDLVRETPRTWAVGPVLSNSFGFGGHNGCLVLGPPAT
ncbi:beta-ketoacyl synthase [Streptomyces eurocidicus]|uniref:3-oxoacyl-[acyl-carrier-protein] synthase II n=1 Tax=Streptomyces eurocidicus TaxID=66423 RepID=A0A2N8NVK2_STREU|nr:beta-ketoacyl-[acyl-carrier-protein] synthase family protein [Streptomyces eurocidicus]MBB5122294.1 3-oxoacyl-[acyl-carrier-protein] synthase II [Streptomyces eurocidicus]MBF6055176.1 beta-ketoacyl synthase [Streptomyces eurocidicus]PNE32808.1 beta-ketoacyl synthase [Streptomyces eurocidicus]